ncbi:MAG: auxin-responsive promoter family protein, partial [Chitinophagaceae bacterium]|nr:auxin-responsive promoter family protein [Chitinophagaceae bacterium]
MNKLWKEMNFKSLLARPFAQYIYKQVRKGMETALADQEAILKELIKGGRATQFGKDHQFEAINSYDDFKRLIPVRDYEKLKPYIEMIKEGR